jgi:hypothetical protein
MEVWRSRNILWEVFIFAWGLKKFRQAEADEICGETRGVGIWGKVR